jgi:hypothetical protein
MRPLPKLEDTVRAPQPRGRWPCEGPNCNCGRRADGGVRFWSTWLCFRALAEFEAWCGQQGITPNREDDGPMSRWVQELKRGGA